MKEWSEELIHLGLVPGEKCILLFDSSWQGRREDVKFNMGP